MKWWRRLTRSDAAVRAAELQEQARDLAATAITDARPGEPATLAGTVRTVTVRPRAGVPALEAELYDGTGVVTLVWLGRRQVRGITPGRAMVVTGRLTQRGKRGFVFNPRYELRPIGSV